MCPIAAKAQAVEVQADLLLDSSVKMKRLQNVLSSRTCFLWLYWQWVGDQNCGLLSALRMNFLVYGQILCCRTDSLTMNSDGGVEALKKAKSKWTVMNLPQLGFMSSIFQSLITVWSLSNQLMFLFSAPPQNHKPAQGLAASPWISPKFLSQKCAFPWQQVLVSSSVCAVSQLHKEILNFNNEQAEHTTKYDTFVIKLLAPWAGRKKDYAGVCCLYRNKLFFFPR